ncbi:C40 family peptidase, partial [candidate division WOR-3 bacterium]|nr:C40 family peptidase [candidate division WOR-3 bacterium]
SSKKIQDKETPKGIDMSRVSVKGDYDSTIVQWASSYLKVPYVFGIKNPAGWYDPAPNEYGEGILKHIHKGYEGLECAGLVSWAYIWVGEDLDNNPATPDWQDVVNTGCNELETYYGKDTLEMDDAVDGDMWFLDSDEDGVITHVGIYVEIDGDNYILHASSQGYDDQGQPSLELGDKVVKRTFELSRRRDHIQWVNWFAGNVSGQAGLGRRPHN